jgi:hypothetical protein
MEILFCTVVTATKRLLLRILRVVITALRHGEKIRKRQNSCKIKECGDKDHNGTFARGAFFGPDSVQLFHTDLDLG